MSRHLLNRLYYFTIEDESMLAEAFSRIEQETYAITFKVADTNDVFVATHDTKEALDRHDVPYNLLASEESTSVAIYHTPLSQEELGDFEDAVKALALAYRAIAMVCVGVNGETDLGFDLSAGTKHYTYFTAPAGHTFIWRYFRSRDDAIDFVSKLTAADETALEWADSIPLESSEQLVTYH